MATNRIRSFLHHLQGLSASSRVREVGDRELVERFVSDRDNAAFTALVQRHGPTVLNLCRRLLRNDADAEDAFQATFLVLARKAHTLHGQASVGGWLYGVAYRTALKARTARARRRAREATAPAAAGTDPLTEMTVHEAQGVVDQELAKLPEKFRTPLVLCCLESLARDEAARQLGWSLGLLKSRLEQAREQLRRRLARRGLSLPAGMLSLGLLGTAAQAAVPAALAEAAVQAAALAAVGSAVTPIISAQAIALAEGVMRAMLWTKVLAVSAVVLVLVTVSAGVSGALLQSRAPDERRAPAQQPAEVAPPEPAGERLALSADALARWGQTEAVFTARLMKVEAGPVAFSNPPIYNHRLHLQVEKVLRGPLKKGDQVIAAHSARQQDRPTFPEGKECVVAGSINRGQWRVQSVQETDAEALAQAERACMLPLGWSMEADRLLSPWARLGKKAWPAEARGKGPLVCAETGRPALLAGAGVELAVEPVPPKEQLKYGNPDGDGEYRITIKNATDKPLAVPALLSDGNRPLWDESVIILCQGKVYPAPGAQGVTAAARPTVLQPGETTSGVINVLRLQGPEWPKGGYRIEFQFCLGEKSGTHSFYYFSRHHDPLREKAANPPEKREE